MSSKAEGTATTDTSTEVVVAKPKRGPRGLFSRSDSSALERFSAAVASAAASVSNTLAPSNSRSNSTEGVIERPTHLALDDEESVEAALAVASAAIDEVANSENPSECIMTEAAQTEPLAQNSASSSGLRVPGPSGFGGAIPRRPFSRDSSAESNSSNGDSMAATKTCFCGHYTEGPSAPKRGRCKFCRSRAKYILGQRSFDASRLFGRRRERGEPRRAASEDQRKQLTTQASHNPDAADRRMTDATSTSSLDASNSQLRRTWRLRPSVRRQERLDLDVPGCSSNLENSTSPSRDHGLRTPPGPPLTSSNNPPIQQRTRPTTLSDDMLSSSPNYLDPNSSQRYATHVMASDMSGLLAPPSRSGALARAHTDPTSNYSEVIQPQQTPNSPPPTYEEVMKQPRVAPPSYEEALSSRVVTSLRLGQTGNNIRSLSEDRATSHPSPPPPFRGRNSSSGNLRPLTRSSRVEEIPDIYWEQAARELDFCTCRKCQARYRQYFEEDLATDPNNDAEAMIPMETQVLMQEVLTDGMAFCSLM